MMVTGFQIVCSHYHHHQLLSTTVAELMLFRYSVLGIPQSETKRVINVYAVNFVDMCSCGKVKEQQETLTMMSLHFTMCYVVHSLENFPRTVFWNE